MFRKSGFLLGRRLCFAYRRVSFVPHPDKVETGGEDAFLCMENVQAVLDGVSWWRDNAGVDAGLYSAAVSRSMYDYVEEELLGETPVSSFRLLERGYEDCKHSDVKGTATALVATLQGLDADVQEKDGYKLIQLDTVGDSHYADVDNNLLDVVSLGDCSLMLIRNGKILYMTEEQQHDMDFPFQLGTGSADTPKDAIKILIPVEPGDVVVMGSDGVFDNIYADKLASAIWGSLDQVYKDVASFRINPTGNPIISSTDPASSGSRNPRIEMTNRIMSALEKGMKVGMDEAIAISRDVRSDSPYAAKCIENGAMYEGGKPDDMTLLVSVIGLELDEMSGDRFVNSEELFPIPYRDWP